MADDKMPEDEREDMISILRDLRPYYFWILMAQVAVWGCCSILVGERELR